MALDDLDPFDLLDAEAERLDRHFASLRGDDWRQPSRCAGWTVRDVLAHLAGGEEYNHACLDDDLESLFARLDKEGITGITEFNQRTVRTRQDRPVADVLSEWRTASSATRRRMRALGRDAPLPTMAGAYPAGLQAFHYASEYATHADDVNAPDATDPARVRWRARVGRFALAEGSSPATVDQTGDGDYVVQAGRARATLTPPEFVEATVGRLPDGRLDETLTEALRCLA
jgi:uncharacterized protein (TIGR03083 family)